MTGSDSVFSSQFEAWVTRQLAQILTNQGQQMATEAALQTDLDSLKTAVMSYIATSTTAMAALTAELGTPSPATQAQIDALDAETQGITALLSPPPPAPAA